MGLMVVFGFVGIVSLGILFWMLYQEHKMNKKKEQYL